MLDRQESDVAPRTASEQVDRAVVEQEFVGSTGFGEGSCLAEGVHRRCRPVEELDVTERSNRIEIGGSTGANLDRRFDIEWFGPADGEHAAAPKAEIEKRNRQTLVVDMVNRDAYSAVCNEYRSQLGEHLDHHLARVERTRKEGDTVCRHEPDSIERFAAHDTDRASVLCRHET